MGIESELGVIEDRLDKAEEKVNHIRGSIRDIESFSSRIEKLERVEENIQINLRRLQRMLDKVTGLQKIIFEQMKHEKSS